MTEDLRAVDRLRIERVVWDLDQRLYELPRAARVARRRELRDNLRDAARDVGIDAALRDVGSPAVLAREYLDAELGTGPRHSWLAAGLFLATVTIVLTSVLFDAAEAFGEGLLAADPAADGTFRWSGVSLLQSEATYTVADGEQRFTGGAFTPVTWVLLLGGAILVGRLWRAVPALRRSRASRATASDPT